MTTLGFYGKLASRGDFVSRALPQSFIGPWDNWLAAGLLASQNSLGAGWLNAYLVSPLWRFVLAPGVCGPDAAAGVVMPSIDRVGRYFPRAVVALLDHNTNPAS
ncbi:type VI secretion system-associated protein TagF, partial [Pseudomonas sp. UBA4034]|uniref:type VI secretion system-associated protein TagF n=1 Tax=Pseudomonas sp. UBA4034 TaxID=1947315 RepID=UPI0025798523